jgi:hypothetical protein
VLYEYHYWKWIEKEDVMPCLLSVVLLRTTRTVVDTDEVKDSVLDWNQAGV